MSEQKWYYTNSLDEACELLRDHTVLPHGGGTQLNNIDLSHIHGLLCLKDLNLNYIKQTSQEVEIGSMTTYADIVQKSTKISTDNILISALKNAANTPLRNRITIGGSLGFIPQWSDLIGPLLALEAKILLIGKNAGEYSLSQFWRHRDLLKSSLITAVRFRDFPHHAYHYRDVKTNNDMPLFTVSTLFDMDGERIKKPHVIIAGTRDRVSEITELENYLAGKKISELQESEVIRRVKVTFVGKRVTDPDYLASKTKIETWRSIIKAAENRL
ncbi:MAG: FAD binding domain-containing protein [Candidatus Marinimicrobia bacterium]|nr:FAD binding domain-containing protein [Candidatus Neomarinimicrobiota bacterium]